MKKLLGFVTLLILCQNYATAQTLNKQQVVPVIPERKPLVFQTVVVDKGKQNAIIVTPSGIEFQKLAARVQLAIQTATGVKLPIVSAQKIANYRGELTGANPVKNMIVLGSFENNGLIAQLYFRGYCAVDRSYPGAAGYVVQTVCDPWGTAANVIVLGGSNLQGVQKATERFCTELPKGSTLTIARNLRAVYNKNYEAPDLTDDDIAKEMVKATAAFKAGIHNGLFPMMVRAGNNYKLTGKEGQAKLFRELFLLEYNLRINSPNDFDSPWGSGADMQFAPLMGALDNVEESSSLSNDDRHKLMDILLEYIHYYEKYGYIPAFKTGIIRHNHHTFPGQGFSAAGRYFIKYYPGYSDGPKWLGMGDDCFRVQQQSWKSQENSSAYFALAMRHMSYYATTRQDFTWFDSGRANISGDLAIMTMDNLGSQCAFGDIDGYNPQSHFELWGKLAIIQRKGRYAWAINKGHAAIGLVPSESDSIPVHITAVEPTDLLGTRYMPLDSLFFVSLNGVGKAQGKVPRNLAFDKLTFRSSFDPQKQYLAIDGINTGYHSHRDGNAVLRLSDHSRIWLADGDYIKASAKYHNTLLIFRNGEATPMPLFIRRDLVADLPSVGISRTTMPDYGGTDWTRNIIWDKERAFIFIDEVKANSEESYSVRTLWHTLGKPAFNGNAFNLSQQGENFSIQNLDGSQLRNFKDVETGKNWVTYKYADPVINTLQQIRNVTLRKGEKTYVINVMNAYADGKAPIAAARVNDSSLLVGTGNSQALIGMGSIKLNGIQTNAGVYWITHNHVALAGATQLTLNNKKVFLSADSISAEVSGTGIVFSADKATKITLYGSKNGVLLDKKAIRSSAAGSSFIVNLPAGKHLLTGISLPKEFSIQFPPPTPAVNKSTINIGSGKLVAKAQFTPGNSTTARPTAISGNGAYVAGTNGVLYAMNSDLKPRWNYTVGGDISAVWTGKLGKSAAECIVAGNTEGRIVVLDQKGKLLWEQQVPLYRTRRAVVYFLSADLTGDGNLALIVGATNWYNYAYDASGKFLWNYMCTHGASAGAAFDLDGDGKQEILSGTEYYSWAALTPEGKPKWSIRGGPGANDVAVADLNHDGKPMIFMAGADGFLYAINPDGKRPWTYSTGDGATCIQFMDVDGDGKQEVVVGSLSSDVVALKPDGKRVWRRDIGEPVLCMVKADINGDGKMELVIGTEDGHVIALNNDGQPIANWTTNAAVNKLIALPNGSIAAVTNTGKLVILGKE
ncbi:MAG: FG-GAP-like repeat-containing protein [Bacteroidota bacterium]